MMQQASQAPNSIHASAASICEKAFRAMGLHAERAVDYRDGYDFLVEGKIKVAVRYAIPTSDRQQLYTKRNGEVSRYTYKRWTFNFHRHGKRPERYCDFFVCFLAAAPSEGVTDPVDVTVFTIPWEAITGLTFCSSVREGSSRPYRGKYAVYQDAWHLIEKAARGSRSLGERKVLRISSDHRRRLELMIGADASEAKAPSKRSGSARDHQTRPASGAGDRATAGQTPAGQQRRAGEGLPPTLRLNVD